MNANDYINAGMTKLNQTDASNAKAYFSNANDTFKYAGSYKLEVLNGVHAGSTYIQKTGKVRVGSSHDNDVILFGSTAAPNHFEINLQSGLITKLQITPIDASITLEDGSMVEVGQHAEILTDEIIAFGDTEISVCRIADPKSFVKPSIRILAFICVLTMIPLVYVMAAGFLGTVSEAGSRVASTMQSGIERTSTKIFDTVSNTTTSEKEHEEAFAWTVRVKLEDLKLNHKLRVQPTVGGSIRVYGNISDKELPRWTSFLQWYDSTSNFPPLIRDVSRAKVGNNLPQIKSVWLDDNPSVFFKDGIVGNIGSSIKGGWKIVDITNASVMIERDGAILSLTY